MTFAICEFRRSSGRATFISLQMTLHIKNASMRAEVSRSTTPPARGAGGGGLGSSNGAGRGPSWHAVDGIMRDTFHVQPNPNVNALVDLF
jgi:hypothetical protein